VPIIRRNTCFYATLGICYSVWMIVWYAGSCIPDNYPYRITNTKCCIKTGVSPDDGHIVSRNTQRKEINRLRKTVHQVGFIYKIIQGCRSTKHKIVFFVRNIFKQSVFVSIADCMILCE